MNVPMEVVVVAEAVVVGELVTRWNCLKLYFSVINLLIFNCKQCNQEGHMARDCPNPGSGSGRSTPRARTNTAPASDDWGTSSTSSSSPWATGANAVSRTNAAPASDDWGTSSTTSSSPWATGANAVSRTNAAPASDDWGTSSTPSSSPWATGANAAPRGGGRATPSASKSNDDDWGAAAHSWASVTG